VRIQAFQTPISKAGSSDIFSPYDLGIPRYLGVLFMYSSYAFPYCLRQKRSSGIAFIKCEIENRIESSKKSQEAEAIPTHNKNREELIYIGCLE
jgi:hypothetical protein